MAGGLRSNHPAAASRSVLVAVWLIFAAVCAAWTSQATAHSNEYLETITGPHGGKVRMAEQYHFEMALANGEVRMWVTDHGDNPQSTAGATGNVKFVTDAGIVSVNLNPNGANGLVGKNEKIKTGAAMKAIATVKMKGAEPLQTRFAFDTAARK